MCRAILKRSNFQLFDYALHFSSHSFFICSQIQYPKRDLLVHTGGKELIVRLLKYDPHSAPHIQKPSSRVLNRLSIDAYSACIRLSYSIQAKKERRFSRTVSAHESNFCPVPDLKIQTIQRFLIISLISVRHILRLYHPAFLSLHFIILHILTFIHTQKPYYYDIQNRISSNRTMAAISPAFAGCALDSTRIFPS